MPFVNYAILCCMTNFIRHFFASVLTVSLAAGLGWSLTLEPAAALVVAPNRITQTVDPGETFNKKIRITNETTLDQTYTLSIQPFEFGLNGELLLNQGSSTPVSWLSLDQIQVTATPGQTAEVTVTVNTPTEVQSGGYAASVVVTPASGSIEVVSSTQVMLNVKGGLEQKAEFSVFGVNDTVFKPGDQIEFQVEFKNTGNANLTPIGQIDLYRGEDWIGDIPLNPKKQMVLVGATRQFDVTWNSTLGFGKYTAIATVSAENDLQVESAPASFWVLSWERVVPVVVALLTFLIAASVLLRHPAKQN